MGRACPGRDGAPDCILLVRAGYWPWCPFCWSGLGDEFLGTMSCYMDLGVVGSLTPEPVQLCGPGITDTLTAVSGPSLEQEAPYCVKASLLQEAWSLSSEHQAGEAANGCCVNCRGQSRVLSFGVGSRPPGPQGQGDTHFQGGTGCPCVEGGQSCPPSALPCELYPLERRLPPEWGNQAPAGRASPWVSTQFPRSSKHKLKIRSGEKA